MVGEVKGSGDVESAGQLIPGRSQGTEGRLCSVYNRQLVTFQMAYGANSLWFKWPMVQMAYDSNGL